MDAVRRRSHEARLYPTPRQAAALDSQGHAPRALWNLLHEWYTCGRGGIARRPSIAEFDRQLRDARADPYPAGNGSPTFPPKPPSKCSSIT